jgi:uncharacterized oxidoreductase
MDLHGQTILVTGGGSGIGLALARRLVEENTVVIAGREEAKLERARAQVPALRALRLDVTSETEARSVLARMALEFGGVDLLVNSAGVAGRTPLRRPRHRPRPCAISRSTLAESSA